MSERIAPEGKIERASRHLRNAYLFIGGLAVLGLGGGLLAEAAVTGAASSDLVYRVAKHHRQKKSK